MGKVAIVTELSEDGLVQSKGVAHPGGGQVKDRPNGLFQHIIPVFAGPIGVHVDRHGFSLANGIRQASRCWGDVREKERLSRRLSAMADTPRHLPHKALISFSVQGYVIQDKRAAQAVCGRKVAL